ncbi:MAG: tetratricopeptide repeat protein, partial [Thermodesulfovibrio sp.]
AIGVYIFNLVKKDKAKQYEYEAYRNYYKQDFKRAAELFLRAYDNEKNIVYLLNAGYTFSFAGEDKKAIEVLEKVENSDDEVFSNLAKFKLAMILKKTNKEEAANKLKQIVNGKRDFIKDAALYELAKIYEESNREQAKIYHEEIIKRFPSSPFAEIVKDKIKQ